ncbi:unknown [Choristoneura fumiferana multiple nucleopolyhedrovirus]|uniref:Exonuclease domain-containing protein n=1 Tax=Choristoneura fumiferana nuclear polyhedrosis virus TaxID=208973 RepID=Q7TLN5_NPVCF|nr:unknown [Choristoneura fumiferana multiple nucleopolyhedrovirus]AAP29896.1 unknown [Choristoneura fumiferana multiple nucleopolyhedrovirus]
MGPIQTYVFLDLETTGLPKFQNNKTQITELSLQCVSRKELLRPGAVRVCNKLTMCFEPTLSISEEALALTQLSMENLNGQPKFDTKVVDCIESFLSLLASPVCLVAYNGLSFDFPILYKHLKDNAFQLEVHCADAYHAMYAIIDGSGSTAMNRSKSGLVTVRQCPWKRGDRPARSFKLMDLYKTHVTQLAGDKCHRAENDCSMMVELAKKFANEFVAFVDANNCLLSCVNPM